MKVNKHRRLNKILQTLERWAPLEASEVSQHLAIIFSVDENEIKRNVINDLKFLRDEGELVALYYDKHGMLISHDIEPADSFYRIKWQLRSSIENLISGSNEVKKYQAFLQTTAGIEDRIKIRAGIAKETLVNHFLYFELNNELYHLSIPKEAFLNEMTPCFILGLTRTKNSYPQKLSSDFELLEKAYPKTSCLLMSFNDPFISSFDTEAPITLIFHLNESITFLNELNKNSVETLEIPKGQAANLLSYLSFFKDKTQTQHWTDLKREQGQDFITGDFQQIRAPFLFRIKETSGFIIQ